MSSFVIQLDPVAIAPDRTMLDLNSGAIRVGTIDWGDAEVTAYETQEGQYGNSVAAFDLPNRTITIQLGLGMDDGHGGVTQEQARAKLQQKVSLLQREGGQILRQRAGGPAMYADIVKAQVTIPDVWGETGDVEPDVSLVLETLPDFYGDEITLDSISAAGACASVLDLSSAQAAIEGDYPSRCRIVVTDTSGNDQHSAIWGLRSRHYDSAATASLFFEAENLTPLNGAAVSTLAGASGGSAIEIVNPPAGSWVPTLVTNLLTGNAPLTHQGSYRVWARVACTNVPFAQFRLLWGEGSLSTPFTNEPATTGPNFCIVDLGTVRLDAPPVGTSKWFGVIQTLVSAANTAIIDSIYLQPLDESAGRLTSTSIAPASSIQAVAAPATLANDSATGTVDWVAGVGGPPTPGEYAELSLGHSAVSHYLKITNFGFAIPAGATITGVEASLTRNDNNVNGQIAQDNQVQLVKAGVVQSGSNHAAGLLPLAPAAIIYGSSSDLWGVTLTPSDVNNSGFGFALSVGNTSASHNSGPAIPPGTISMTIFYTLASGFTIAKDAVVYSGQVTELRHDGMFRTPDGTVYGPISQVLGDLPRLPPSGVEGRAVEVFVKPSRGDLGALADSLDGFTVQVKYRPCWLSRP